MKGQKKELELRQKDDFKDKLGMKFVDKHWNQIWILLRNVSIILLFFSIVKWIYFIPEKGLMLVKGTFMVSTVLFAIFVYHTISKQHNTKVSLFLITTLIIFPFIV